MNLALEPYKDQSWKESIARLYKEEVERTGRTFIRDKYVDTILQELDNWIQGEYTSCIMTGGVGIGKTALLKAMMRLFDAFRAPITIPPLRCRSIVYYDATELCLKYVASEDVRYEVHHCNVLFIDDAGYEADGYSNYGNFMQPIHDVILSRYSSRLPTVVATNLEFAAFGNRYGKRISDRMNELYAVIQCPPHESYRSLPLIK